MIHLATPVGSSHGWGICGKYISREMAALRPGEVRLIAPPFKMEDLGDELEFQVLERLASGELRARQVNGMAHLEGPLLSCIADKQLLPMYSAIRGTRTVGYTFFEENYFEPTWIENGRRFYDAVATGSSWCTQVLQDYGLTNVHTVIQGVDPRIFFPMTDAGAREFLADRFVIFSGGKFELRKGQDIVIRAVKVMQERHADVVLMNAWFNPWQRSVDSMRGSPYLVWPAASGPFVDVMKQLLAVNGLDISRVITLGPRPNALMARVYRNSDVGLFPNRSEGGTNLVLMEYMACGKPVIATASTGHADIVRPTNALAIGTPTEKVYSGPGGPIARWPEPGLDDVVEKLEWAYQHRQEMRVLGEQAGRDLAKLTWTETAREFLRLLA